MTEAEYVLFSLRFLRYSPATLVTLYGDLPVFVTVGAVLSPLTLGGRGLLSLAATLLTPN